MNCVEVSRPYVGGIDDGTICAGDGNRMEELRLLVLEYVAPESESQGISARTSDGELQVGEVAVVAVAVRE